MKLSDSHFVFRSSTSVKELITPLQQLNVNFYIHYRLYEDGSVNIAMTHPEMFAFFLERESDALFNQSTAASGCHIAGDIVDKSVIDEVLTRIKVDNIINFHDVKEKYIENFILGTKVSTEPQRDRLLSNLDVIETFNDYFRLASSDLFQQGENEKIIIPASMTLNRNVKDIDLRSVKNSKNVFERELIRKRYWTFLSNREFDCLYCLAHGMQAKETAEALSISARTVEAHLAQVRYKMNCRNKLELVRRYWTWQTESFDCLV